MIRVIRAGDLVGFRTFKGAVRYGEVVGVLARGDSDQPARKDEISLRLKPDGQIVMVQRWRVVERYDAGKLRGRRTP
jgi:hypothetical protein